MKKVKILEMADTEVSYCGGAETVIEFESIDIDNDNYDVNPDTGKKWNHRTGISLKVAKTRLFGWHFSRRQNDVRILRKPKRWTRRRNHQ